MLEFSNNRGTLVSKNLAALVLLPFVGAFLSNKNIVLFHVSIESFCIFIAMSMLLIAISTYQHNKNNFIIFLGLSYGFVAYYDLLHIVSSKGFNILTSNDINISMQVWVIARYLESIALLLACIGIKNKDTFNVNKYITLYALASVILTPLVFKWHLFPPFYTPIIEVSAFIKLSSFILLTINLVSIVITLKNKAYFYEKKYKFLIASLCCAAMYILLFSIHHVEMESQRFVLGHLFKLISFYLLYKGIVEVNLISPYRQLKESEAYYKRLLEFSPDGIMIQRDSAIVYANPAFLRIIGMDTAEDIIGKSVLEFLPEELHDTVYHRKRAMKQGEQIGSYEFPMVRTDNTILYVETVTTIVPNGDDTEFISIVRDISDRRSAEEYRTQLENEERELKQKIAYEEMMLEFFTNISHDLKTPLNVILGTVQLLNLMLIDTELYCKTKKYISITRQNCFRLLKLINNILDISKYDNRQLNLQLKNNDIISLIENTTISIGDYIESKGIELVFDTDIEEKAIAFDIDKIERVILNLLSNAIKFTPMGGKIEVTISDQNKYVVISVKDTGVGIPDSELSTIFDRYKQVNASFNKNFQGTGLGLALVKSIVEAHGGQVEVRSQVNAGSEFIFTLPTVLVDEDYVAEARPAYLSSNIERINVEFSDVYSLSY